MVLSMVGILILIYVNVLITLLIISEDIGIFVKEMKSHHNQIVEIHGLTTTKFFLIGLVTFGYDLRIHVTSLMLISYLI